MCTVCGCDTPAEVKPGKGHRPHDHQHHHDHDQSHAHCHVHTHGHGENLDYGAGKAGVHVPGQSQERLIEIERDILGRNDSLAAKNRAELEAREIVTINLLSSPGSGKTTLLTETLQTLKDSVAMAVIEGDQQTTNDADRIRATGVDAIQINTGKGCHLDADMIGHAMTHMTLPDGGYLFIENVGNLVCPAGFDLGEQIRVVLASTTEGEDKPAKYPDMFATADVILMTKADLLPYLSFDRDAFEQAVRSVNGTAPILSISSTAEGGLSEWLEWLEAQRRSAVEAAE